MNRAPGSRGPAVDLVIPTSGRSSLYRLLSALAEAPGTFCRIIVVDDRTDRRRSLLPEEPPPALAGRVSVVAGPARGPAAARNRGWRLSGAEWVLFLDDDVVPSAGWAESLARDLGAAGQEVGGSQGTIRVPLPPDREPTDWERDVRGLEGSRWITADMAYRREVLVGLGGFDERFPRAYREDADLGLRVTEAGYRIEPGERLSEHPVGPADPLVSLRRQKGNADDALMLALHGPLWRRAAGVPRGRRGRHLAATAAGLVGLCSLLSGRRLSGLAGLGLYLAGISELAWRRISPGPRASAEVSKMLLTSAVMPPLASYHWLAGLARYRGLLAASALRARGEPKTGRPAAVLFDRDGTLIEDLPYNGSPDLVRPAPGSGEALSRLKRAGIPTAVISNQSGLARGLLSGEQVAEVNRRVEELLGPLGPWLVCPHGPDEGCACRKPAPGLVLEAAGRLGVEPARCAVIGDIGSDIEAARAAGARAVLVPTPATRPEEIRAAPEVAASLPEAVGLLLGEVRR